MILDLSVFQQETFDITLPNGEVVNVKKPTQRIVIELVSLSSIQQDNSVAVIEGLVDACATILSNNTNGKTYDVDWVSNELNMAMIVAIIQNYSEFVKEIQSNPI